MDVEIEEAHREYSDPEDAEFLDAALSLIKSKYATLTKTT